MHLPGEVPLGSAGPGGRAKMVSSPKLGSTRTFLKQVESRADGVNVNSIPQPLAVDVDCILTIPTPERMPTEI